MVSFLIFGRNPERGNADKLQLVAINDVGAEVGVDNVDGDKKGLWVKFVLEVDVDEPVEEDHAHVFCDVGLGFKVVEVLWRFAG